MKTRLLLTGLIVVAGLSATSCSGLSMPGPKSSSDKSVKTSAASLQPGGDAREDVKKAFTALVGAKSFRAHLANNGKGMMEIEYVAPDRLHTMGQANAGGQASPPEMIIVGKDTFFKVGIGSWRKAPAGMSIGDLVQKFRQPDVSQEMMKYVEVKYVGSDVLDGSPMMVYQFRKKDKELERSGKLWIGAADGLPYKIESEGTAASGNGDTKQVVTYDYGSDIKIEPPISS